MCLGAGGRLSLYKLLSSLQKSSSRKKCLSLRACVSSFPGEPVVHADSLAQLGSKDDMSGDSHGC